MFGLSTQAIKHKCDDIPSEFNVEYYQEKFKEYVLLEKLESLPTEGGKVRVRAKSLKPMEEAFIPMERLIVRDECLGKGNYGNSFTVIIAEY